MSPVGHKTTPNKTSSQKATINFSHWTHEAYCRHYGARLITPYDKESLEILQKWAINKFSSSQVKCVLLFSS